MHTEVKEQGTDQTSLCYTHSAHLQCIRSGKVDSETAIDGIEDVGEIRGDVTERKVRDDDFLPVPDVHCLTPDRTRKRDLKIKPIKPCDLETSLI